jgi:hypothetical protein
MKLGCWECYGYVGPFDLGDGAFDDNVIDLPVIVFMFFLVPKPVLEPLMIVRIVSWVGKLSIYCEGS